MCRSIGCFLIVCVLSFAAGTLAFGMAIASQVSSVAQAPALVTERMPRTVPFTKIYLSGTAVVCPRGEFCWPSSMAEPPTGDATDTLAPGDSQWLQCSTSLPQSGCYSVGLADVCPGGNAGSRVMLQRVGTVASVVILALTGTLMVFVVMFLLIPPMRVMLAKPRTANGFYMLWLLNLLAAGCVLGGSLMSPMLLTTGCSGYVDGVAPATTRFPGEIGWSNDSAVPPAPLPTFSDGTLMTVPTLESLGFVQTNAFVHSAAPLMHLWFLLLFLPFCYLLQRLPTFCSIPSDSDFVRVDAMHVNDATWLLEGASRAAPEPIQRVGFDAPDSSRPLNRTDSAGSSALGFKENECITCNERRASVTFAPCGHAVMCRDCCVRLEGTATAANPAKCPMCRAGIERMRYAPAEGAAVPIPPPEE